MTASAYRSSALFGRARVCFAALACLVSLSAAADGPAPNPGTATYETNFMEGMIDHHVMAVEMSETCVQKAVHEELRALCEQIIAAQNAEIAMMQGWLQEWYGIGHEPQMMHGAMQRMEKVASLDGADYEVAFLESMIRHHRSAIVEGAQCLDRAYHPELQMLCENIIATQSDEIQQMRSWLCEWYGECRPQRMRMRH